jgi:hypothetical protein
MVIPSILLAARWLLGAVFVAAGARKVRLPSEFRAAIANYRLVPARFERPLALALPWGEIVVGTLFALGIVTSVIAWTASIALAVFGTAVAVNLLRGRSFDCGCGVGGGGHIRWSLVGRNLVLSGIAATIAVAPGSALAAWPGGGASAGSISVGDYLPVPMTVVLVAVIGRVASLVRTQKPRQTPAPRTALISLTVRAPRPPASR